MAGAARARVGAFHIVAGLVHRVPVDEELAATAHIHRGGAVDGDGGRREWHRVHRRPRLRISKWLASHTHVKGHRA